MLFYALDAPIREATMTTVTISLPESLREFVDRQVKTAGYGNVSEYFGGCLEKPKSAKRISVLRHYCSNHSMTRGPISR